MNLVQRRFKLAYQYMRKTGIEFKYSKMQKLHKYGALKYLGQALLAYRAQVISNNLHLDPILNFHLPWESLEHLIWQHRNKLQRLKNQPKIKLP